ncbi:MAG: hypothetical protein LBJ97_02395 [Mycoplasmataceae bacterium]|jgi:hypothetical protein|nr:hypothetical protein [Mycoplasmataceae bacterium]
MFQNQPRGGDILAQEDKEIKEYTTGKTVEIVRKPYFIFLTGFININISLLNGKLTNLF